MTDKYTQLSPTLGFFSATTGALNTNSLQACHKSDGTEKAPGQASSDSPRDVSSLDSRVPTSNDKDVRLEGVEAVQLSAK